MRSVIVRCTLTVLLAPAIFAGGQTIQIEKPAAEFTLSIRQWPMEAMSPGTHALLVAERNISAAELSGPDCGGMADWLNLIVVYDGARLPETDAVRRLLRRRRAGGPCYGDNGGWHIAPGEEHRYMLILTNYYDMSKPGTYKITVTKDTVPGNPVMNTVVKSNTITIVVARRAETSQDSGSTELPIIAAADQSPPIKIEKPAPRFSLKIEQVGYGGTLPGYYALLVHEKNVSDTDILRTTCFGLGDGVDLALILQL